MAPQLKIRQFEQAMVPPSNIPAQYRRRGEEMGVVFIPPEDDADSYELGSVYLIHTKRFSPEIAGNHRNLGDIAREHACDGITILKRRIMFMKLIGGPNSARAIADLIKDMIPRTCTAHRSPPTSAAP